MKNATKKVLGKREWKDENLEEIDALDDEIKQLEKKLGGGKRVNKGIEMEGMGIGFLDFLDGIDSKVKGTKSGYKKSKYDFLDDSKEVALAEEDFADDSEDQDGFEMGSVQEEA